MLYFIIIAGAFNISAASITGALSIFMMSFQIKFDFKMRAGPASRGILVN
jgi:hypothetical protein